MRHFFYVLLGGFALLVMLSMATEKPRQYRVAKGPDKAESAAVNAQTSQTIEPPAQPRPSPAAPISHSKSATVSPPPSPSPAPNNTATVIAYSRNDVGGKIVLTAANCEKNTGLNAYTTHPDGAIDFGCWGADELHVMVHWDKTGLQNYGHDRFYSLKTNERLTGTMLLDLAREPLSRFANKPASSLARKP